jgi:hypothetical protein
MHSMEAIVPNDVDSLVSYLYDRTTESVSNIREVGSQE